jgi:hypothetical protein
MGNLQANFDNRTKTTRFPSIFQRSRFDSQQAKLKQILKGRTIMIPFRNSPRGHAIATWFRQMKAALNHPIPHDSAAGSIDFAERVDRGINRLRSSGIDPRI